jgi:hypothetical protein
MKSLYHLSQELESALDQSLEESNINEIVTSLQKKTDGVAGYALKLSDQIDLIDSRIKQLKALKESMEAKKERFDEYVMFCMQQLGVSELDGDMSTLKLTETPGSVEIINKDLVDVEYVELKQEAVIRKDLILKKLREGEEVNGCALKKKKKLKYKVL